MPRNPLTVTPAQIDSAAARAHVAAALLRALVQQESGGSTTVRSPAGAIGPTQLMPATAAGLHVDPFNPEQNLLGGATYLRQQLDRFHTPALALAAYNAGPNAVAKYGGIPPYRETQNYVKTVLANAGSYRSPGTPALQPSPAQPSARPQASDWTTALRGTTRPRAAGSWVDALSGTTTTAAPTATAPKPSSWVDALSGKPPASQPGPLPLAQPRTVTQPPAPTGRVTLSANADRAGVAIHPQVVQFVGRIAGLYGQPLEIGTGTNHNEYVSGTHRESAHWTGWAADVPASGDQLTRLGQSALVAAGMSPAQARQATGGLFNVNGYQIIFNSHIGGNHFNHLHVGLAPSRQRTA